MPFAATFRHHGRSFSDAVRDEPRQLLQAASATTQSASPGFTTDAETWTAIAINAAPRQRSAVARLEILNGRQL